MNSDQLNPQQPPFVSDTQQSGITSVAQYQVPPVEMRPSRTYAVSERQQAPSLQINRPRSERPPLHARNNTRLTSPRASQYAQRQRILRTGSGIAEDEVPRAIAVQGAVRSVFVQCPWCASLQSPYNRILQVVAQQLAALDAALPFQRGLDFIDPEEIESGIAKTELHGTMLGEIGLRRDDEAGAYSTVRSEKQRQGKRKRPGQGAPSSKRRRLGKGEHRAVEAEGSGDIIQDLIEECRKLAAKERRE